MAQIISCKVVECAFNVDMMCQIMTITVGDHYHPMCDAFCRGREKSDLMGLIGNVAACRMEACRFNEDGVCMAFSGVKIIDHEGHADCSTYMTR